MGGVFLGVDFGRECDTPGVGGLVDLALALLFRAKALGGTTSWTGG